MEIKKYNQAYINEVVYLLGTSFEVYQDNHKLKKFKYKHHENPFGESIAFISMKDNTLTGFRSFMQWKWQLQNKVYNSYRAIDAITHPSFLRQGIFNKLTKVSLDEIQKKNGLIFNTPNHKSLAGNLKLGWSKVGNISFRLHPILLNLNKSNTTPEKEITNINSIEELCEIYNLEKSKTNQLFTPKSAKYIEWRFYKNPFIDYYCFSSQEFFLACYKKTHSKFNELRISELLLKSKKSKKILKDLLYNIAKENNCRVITISKNIKLFPIEFKLSFGPILVANNFTNALDNNFILDINNWGYELGDLELF